MVLSCFYSIWVDAVVIAEMLDERFASIHGSGELIMVYYG